jgi:hypothetical protein
MRCILLPNKRVRQHPHGFLQAWIGLLGHFSGKNLPEGSVPKSSLMRITENTESGNGVVLMFMSDVPPQIRHRHQVGAGVQEG